MKLFKAISRDDTVSDVLAKSPHAARVLFDCGMHCVGCAIAPFETIAEACAIYGVSVDRLLTVRQAARLWSVSASESERLLSELVESRFLVADSRGAYRRRGCPRCS